MKTLDYFWLSFKRQRANSQVTNQDPLKILKIFEMKVHLM